MDADNRWLHHIPNCLEKSISEMTCYYLSLFCDMTCYVSFCATCRQEMSTFPAWLHGVDCQPEASVNNVILGVMSVFVLPVCSMSTEMISLLLL